MFSKRASLTYIIMHKPQDLQSICLAEFAATYVTKYEHKDGSECDALPASESETMSTQIVLNCKINKRKQEAVIRFYCLTKKLSLVIGIEQNSCCITPGMMSREIYWVAIQPMKSIKGMCMMLYRLMPADILKMKLRT